MWFKRLIVSSLETTCSVLDKVPGVWKDDDGLTFHKHSYYGCNTLRLCEKSERLDEKWGTGIWEDAA